jgi:hypothetical protein
LRYRPIGVREVAPPSRDPRYDHAMGNRALSALVVLVAACGGDDGGDDAADSPSGDAAVDGPTLDDEATECPALVGDPVVGLTFSFSSDATHFYFWDNEARELRRTPIAGGASELVTPVENLEGPFTIGDQYAFFMADGSAQRVLKTGGTPEVLGTLPGTVLKRATDGIAYYTLSLVESSFEIRRAETPGVAPVLLTTGAATGSAIDAFATDGAHVYWTSGGILSRVATTGGAIEMVADSRIDTPAITTSPGLVFTPDDVIWSASYQSFDDGRLFAIAKAGGDRRTLSRTGLFWGLDLHDGVIYAALVGDQSAIAAVPLDGSPRTIVGCVDDRLFDVDATSAGIFAVEDRTVLRFPLPSM